MHGTHISRVQNFTMNEKKSTIYTYFMCFIVFKYYKPMKEQDSQLLLPNCGP